MHRPRNRGDLMRMLRMEVLNSVNLEFQQDSAWEFKITSRTNVTERNVRLRLILKTNVAAPIAMTHTPPFDVTAGEVFTLRIRFPLNGIAPGEYMVKLSLVSDRVGGVSNYFDTIEDVGQFTIVDDPQVNDGYLWAERLWGNMRFPPLEMQRVETEEA